MPKTSPKFSVSSLVGPRLSSSTQKALDHAFTTQAAACTIRALVVDPTGLTGTRQPNTVSLLVQRPDPTPHAVVCPHAFEHTLDPLMGHAAYLLSSDPALRPIIARLSLQGNSSRFDRLAFVPEGIVAWVQSEIRPHKWRDLAFQEALDKGHTLVCMTTGPITQNAHAVMAKKVVLEPLLEAVHDAACHARHKVTQRVIHRRVRFSLLFPET